MKRFIEFMLAHKWAQTSLSGILDGLGSCVFLIVGVVKFSHSLYADSALWLFFALIFQMQSLYYFIISKLERMDRNL